MTLVKHMAGATALGVAMLIGCGLCAPPAQAGYMVTLEQVGTDVVATGSGTIDLTGLMPFAPPRLTIGGRIIPEIASIFTGPTPATSDIFIGLTGPTSYGSGGVSNPSSGAGDIVGLSGLGTTLFVPADYVSGAPLSDTSTYDNQTFASLGVTPGVYKWTWGSGADQNFTLDAVPEPASLVLLGVALAGLALVRTRRSIRASE